MSILDIIYRDAKDIASNVGDFAGPLTFIHGVTGLQVTVDAIHTLHHLGYDLQTAQEINTLKGHVCVHEKVLNDAGYATRGGDGHVTFENHRVKAKEANGTEWLYVVQQWFPNGRTGTVSLILGANKL